MVNIINNNQTEEDIKRELEGEEDLDEDRVRGTGDEAPDDDPDDTTPSEATELADEGEELIKKERERHLTHDEFED